MSFQSFSLDAQLLLALEQHGILTPTPVQLEAIPQALEGHDLQACAQTGTGKTLAFLLPMLHKLSLPAELQGKGPRGLILVPTRELAEQVAEEAVKFSCNLRRVKTVCVFGGVPYGLQKRVLTRPYEILVATPGRLIDWMQQGFIDFSRLEMMVLDEADRMLDMGFADDVRSIADATPETRQTLLFSATLKGKVLDLSHALLKSPIQITTSSDENQTLNIEQRVYYVDDLHHKNRMLDHFLNQPDLKQAIVFTATKTHADVLAEQLGERGVSCAALHGDMSQRQRSRTLERLKAGQIQILIATDVAARGVHVNDLTHVINFDLPFRVEDYVHRIGRTGRAGASGVAITFASGRETSFVRRIEQYSGHKMNVHTVEGMEPRKRADGPSPSRERRPFRSSGSYQGGGDRQGGSDRQGGGGYAGSGSRSGGGYAGARSGGGGGDFQRKRSFGGSY